MAQVSHNKPIKALLDEIDEAIEKEERMSQGAIASGFDKAMEKEMQDMQNVPVSEHIHSVATLQANASTEYDNAVKEYQATMNDMVECFGNVVRKFAVLQQFNLMTQLQDQTDIIVDTASAVAQHKNAGQMSVK